MTHPKFFGKAPCHCGAIVTMNGMGYASHLKGKAHRLGIERRGQEASSSAEPYDVLLARCERAEARVQQMQVVLEQLLDTALPSSMLRVPPSIVEAVRDALRMTAPQPTNPRDSRCPAVSHLTFGHDPHARHLQRHACALVRGHESNHTCGCGKRFVVLPRASEGGR